MNINHIFLGFTVLVGIACGLLLVARPELRDAAIMPFLWVLIAMAIFEMGMYARLGAILISIEMRMLGFFLAVLFMAGIPFVAGSPGRLF